MSLVDWKTGLQHVKAQMEKDKMETTTTTAPVFDDDVAAWAEARVDSQPKKVTPRQTTIRARRRLILKLARVAKPVSVSRLAGELSSRTGTPVQSAVQMIYGMAHSGDLPLDWLTLAANFRRVPPAPRSEPKTETIGRPAKTARNSQIAEEYAVDGKTLQQIADEHGLTRERIRQIVRKARQVGAVTAVRFGGVRPTPKPAAPRPVKPQVDDAVRIFGWMVFEQCRGRKFPADIVQILQRRFGS